jgi:hypothetical protein
MQMLKKIIISITLAVLFWTLCADAFAVISLDNSLKPDNLPGIEVVDPINNDMPETAATQTLILFVGNLVSKVLLFAGSVSIIFLIASGANYIFAFGKDERLEKGKRGMFWAIAGLLVILLSYAIVQGIIKLLLQVDADTVSGYNLPTIFLG